MSLVDKLNWSVNVKRWNKTIAEYITFTKKNAEEATFRQAKNLLFYVAKEMPNSRFKKGSPALRLREYFKDRAWVAGMVVARYFKRKGALIVKEMHTRKGVTGRALMTTGSRGRPKFVAWKNDDRKVRYYTREMAIKENKRRIKMIANRFGFAQLIPLKAVEALKVIAKKHGINIGAFRVNGDKPNKKWQGENAIVHIKKSDNRIDMNIVSSYHFKSSFTMFGKGQDQNAQFYDDAISKALPKAMANTIADIKGYMEKKMAERAQKLNKQ